ncbi:MAG: amidase [Rhodospirillales bacterium]|jgi:aspartyl-tRNA(Asn)/glutamyl-tRNA(Gln) amidotransferase subunit A|nr:amidase [Rhodospirillales bacterium]
MATLPPDPFEPGGMVRFGARLRDGEITAEAATAAYLARIEILDSRLGAYEYVAAEAALAAARDIDRQLAGGEDHGPLMGVPVALKDLIAIEGMPTTAGSNVDVADVIGVEGTFVKALRRAGCVILGKLKTVEFARGAAGVNRVRGTPWNPWDSGVHRIPGGSSSGSAVAMAAGLSAFTIGTDTGGSVRGPAAFCGVFGLKTTIGTWSIDGIFPNSPTFDTIGPLTRSAADAACVYSALTGRPVPPPPSLAGLRLGKPLNHFFDSLDGDVERCTATAIAALEGDAEIVPIEVPEVAEREEILRVICATECVAAFGRDSFIANQDIMDPLTVARTAPGLDVPAERYIRVLNRQRALCRIVGEGMGDLDGWITPTTCMVAPTVAEVNDIEAGLALEAKLGLNTHPASFFGLCATTTPVNALGSALPVGLQIVCAGGEDAKALSIARALEDLFGLPPKPRLDGFL